MGDRNKILLVQSSSNMDGSSISGLLLVDGLREMGWDSHILFARKGPAVQIFRSHGHDVSVLPFNNWLRTTRISRFIRILVSEIRNSFRIVGLIRRIQPKIIYVNTSVGLAGAIAGYRSKLPVIWHIRELLQEVGGEMRVPTMFRRFVPMVFQSLATDIIANSSAVARNMINDSNIGSCQIVNNCVDDVFFQDVRTRDEARAVFGLGTEELVIGVPGTLRPMKGHLFLFESIGRYRSEFVDVTVIVSGSTDEQFATEVLEKARHMDLSQIRFLGHIDDMSAFNRACDVICIPSSSEPFGRTIIEAFSVGTPVVATAVGGIPEIIDDEQTGILVPFGDKDAMADALLRLLREKTLRQHISKKAQMKAEKLYRSNTYVVTIHEVLRRAIQEERFREPRSENSRKESKTVTNGTRCEATWL